MSCALRTALLVATAVAASAIAVPASSQQTVTLHGAVQFNDDHAFNKSLLKFEELVKKYYGKPINFVLHRNSELGLEKDYFAYMNQGNSVDYAIVSPAHMSTFSRAAPFIDAPFLFRDLDHWNKVLDADVLKPVADEIAQKGGRHADRLRRRRHPQHLRQQAGAQPRRDEGAQGPRAGRADLEPHLRRHGHVADGDRLQRDLQRHPERRHHRRRERGRGRRADEVLRGRPQPLDDRARHHDPAALLLGQDLQELPADLQAAIIKAGKEAGAYGRQVESSEDAAKLDALEKAGKLKRIPFADRAEMKKLVDPVMAAYAKEIGADAICQKINAIK